MPSTSDIIGTIPTIVAIGVVGHTANKLLSMQKTSRKRKPKNKKRADKEYSFWIGG